MVEDKDYEYYLHCSCGLDKGFNSADDAYTYAKREHNSCKRFVIGKVIWRMPLDG